MNMNDKIMEQRTEEGTWKTRQGEDGNYVLFALSVSYKNNSSIGE